jgi:hypothetical protein
MLFLARRSLRSTTLRGAARAAPVATPVATAKDLGLCGALDRHAIDGDCVARGARPTLVSTPPSLMRITVRLSARGIRGR